MTGLIGTDVNVWLVIALLILALGLAGALVAATRNTVPHVRRTR
jgi:hypothetical protein